jgi:hypothetical protein
MLSLIPDRNPWLDERLPTGTPIRDAREAAATPAVDGSNPANAAIFARQFNPQRRQGAK